MHWHDNEIRSVIRLCSLLPSAVLALLVGCSSLPVTNAPDSPGRAREPAPAAEVELPESQQPAKTELAESSTQAVTERRRRDYPEIETDETGFTITEQVRISGDVRADYQRALQLLQQEQFEQGIPLLVAVTERAPDLTAPHIDLGIAYGRSGDLELAEAALKKAAELSPDHPIVHNELGILYRRTGRFPAARASYEKALDVYPGFHFARRNLGVLCDLYLADLNCALQQYEAYMQAVVEDAEVAIWIADIRNRLGQ